MEIQELPVHCDEARKQYGDRVWVLISDDKVVSVGTAEQLKISDKEIASARNFYNNTGGK